MGDLIARMRWTECATELASNRPARRARLTTRFMGACDSSDRVCGDKPLHSTLTRTGRSGIITSMKTKNTEEPKVLIPYARVSSAPQATEDKTGLERQFLSARRTLASHPNWQLDENFS